MTLSAIKTMNTATKTLATATVLYLASLAAPTMAKDSPQWSVNSKASSVHFVSIKKNSIAEVHHFKHITGSISKAGVLSATIDLSGVETGIEIRNTRMQKYLFETEKFATAKVTANVGDIDYQDLKNGQSLSLNTPFTLTLHGKSVTLDADVTITKQADKTLRVVTTQPIILNAKDYGLEAGIAQLMKLAGLNAIATSIPVTFSLSLAAA